MQKIEYWCNHVFRKRVFGSIDEKCFGIGLFVRCSARSWLRQRKVMSHVLFFLFFIHLHFFRFPVHRNIIAASSPFFKAMLGPNYKEANQKEIVLGNIYGHTLKLIIDFCYSGQIKITFENIDDVITAASGMELVQLEERCADFWFERLATESSVNILMAADKFNLKDLWNTSLQFICKNFRKISNAALVETNGTNFNEIICSNEIEAPEDVIIDHFIHWVQHDESNRSQFVATIANSIRLEYVSKKVCI